MPRYVLQRTFTDGPLIPAGDSGADTNSQKHACRADGFFGASR